MEEVDICIPARNEENVILPTLATLLELCDSWTEYSFTVTVVDNGSTDTTVELVKSCIDSRVRLLQQSVPGKGAALTLGASQSTADIFAYIDADLSADPKYIFELLKKIEQGFDIAVGSRLLDTHVVHRSLWRTLTSNGFKFYANFLVPVPVSDSQCGLKVMNKKGASILATCEDAGWFFDREFLAKAVKRKLAIVEVPVEWEEFRYPDRKSKLHVLQALVKSFESLWRIRKSVQRFK